jgi:hypothetical protein
VLVSGKAKWKGRSMTINAEDELWAPPEEGVIEFEVEVIAGDKHTQQVRAVLLARPFFHAASGAAQRCCRLQKIVFCDMFLGVHGSRLGFQRAAHQRQKSIARASCYA